MVSGARLQGRGRGRTFRSLLNAAGVKCVLHDEQFPHKTADEDWLAVVGGLGWLVITGDNETTRSPIFVHRLSQSRAHVFVLLALNGLTAEKKSECILGALPIMRELAAKTAPPGLWRIGKDGTARRFGSIVDERVDRSTLAHARSHI